MRRRVRSQQSEWRTFSERENQIILAASKARLPTSGNPALDHFSFVTEIRSATSSEVEREGRFMKRLLIAGREPKEAAELVEFVYNWKLERLMHQMRRFESTRTYRPITARAKLPFPIAYLAPHLIEEWKSIDRILFDHDTIAYRQAKDVWTEHCGCDKCAQLTVRLEELTEDAYTESAKRRQESRENEKKATN